MALRSVVGGTGIRTTKRIERFDYKALSKTTVWEVWKRRKYEV